MNIEIAERLIKFRKEKGLSQEELADKLGLSRQAVSKWERAEASPDTDNLICLARIYGVSLDELLNTADSVEDIVKEQVKGEASSTSSEDKKKDKVHIGADGIHIESANGEEVHICGDGINIKDDEDDVKIGCGRHGFKPTRYEIVKSAVTGSITLLFVIAFLLLGFLMPGAIGWKTGWILFLLIPVVSSVFSMIRRKRITAFNLPCLVAAVFLLLGMGFGMWHPYWIIFLSIPVFYSIFGPIDRLARHRRFEQHMRDHVVDVDIEEDDGEDEDDEN